MAVANELIGLAKNFLKTNSIILKPQKIVFATTNLDNEFKLFEFSLEKTRSQCIRRNRNIEKFRIEKSFF